jgi:hypothetical protein
VNVLRSLERRLRHSIGVAFGRTRIILAVHIRTCRMCGASQSSLASRMLYLVIPLQRFPHEPLGYIIIVL